MERAEAPGRVAGFAMMFCTLLLWVGSSVVVQSILSGPMEFDKPLFMTVFNNAASALLLLPGALRSTVTAATLRRSLGMASTIGLLWATSQLVYNVSLSHTSVATNTVLSSTSTVFTFVFSLMICREPFRWLSFASAVLSFAGCAIVAMSAPQTLDKSAVVNSNLGDALTVLAAAMFALGSVLLRKFAPEDLDLSAYMGTTGLLAACAAPALLFGAHVAGVESWEAPPQRVLAALTLNAALGCALANYLYNSALLLLSPLVSNICLSLSIPISAILDEVVLGQHRFSALWVLGASTVIASVVLATADFDAGGDSLGEGSLKPRREKAEEGELQPLVQSAD